MSERASVFEKPRFGLEATAGAPVGATHVLQSLTVMPTPQLPRTAIKAAGKMRPVGVVSAKQWTELSLDGELCYHDLAYLLNSALCMATVSAGGASGVSRLTWLPAVDAANTLASYTIEMGSAAGASKVPGVFVSDISVSIDAKSAKLTAKATGKRYDEEVTLTANPVDETLVPVAPDTTSIFVAPTYAGLSDASARLTRCVSTNWGLSGRQSTLMTLDDTQGSFSASVERSFDMNAQIVMEEDAQGVAMMNRMRLQDTFFAQISTVSQRDIVAGQPYKLRITYPAFVSKTQRSDVDDIFAGTYDLEPISVVNAFGAGKTGYVLVEMDVPTAFATSLASAGTAITGYDPSVSGAKAEANSENAVVQTQQQSAGTGGQNT